MIGHQAVLDRACILHVARSISLRVQGHRYNDAHGRRNVSPPGLFTTLTGTPSASLRTSAFIRATISALPPEALPAVNVLDVRTFGSLTPNVRLAMKQSHRLHPSIGAELDFEFKEVAGVVQGCRIDQAFLVVEEFADHA